MDAQQFLAEFGHIANAPCGVDRLRDMVLDLAIQGRLTHSSESQEATLSLLDEIGRWRVSHSQSKKRPRAKIEVPVSNVKKAYSIPDHWIWVLNSDIFSLVKGKNPKDLGPKGKYPYLDIEALDRRNIQRYTNDEQAPRASKADILVVCDGSRSGLVLDGGDGVIGSTLARIDAYPAIQPFVKLLFLHGYRRLNAEKKGAAIPHLDTARLLASPCGLPPLSDQESIVAKVDELMALCDKLEAQQQARRKLQNALRQSTLQAVASSQSPHELQTHWTGLADNFEQLFDAPQDVDDLLGALSSLAVRGMLAEACATPPNLKAIKADCTKLREQYISDGLMRRQKLVGIADREELYPAHWANAAFDELAVVIGGVTKGRNLRGRPVMACPYLAVANVQRGYFKLENLKTIDIAADELVKYRVNEGDLLITEGGDWDKVGRTAIWRGGVSNCLHQNHVFKARVPSAHLLSEWVELVFNSDIGRSYFAGASKQTTNLASINMTQLRSFVLPIPPLEEQRRILDMLAELTKQSVQWRIQLKRKQSLAGRLANAAISSLTGFAIEQEEEPMKAPQTELIAPLRLGSAPDIKARAPLATILVRHNGEMSAKDLWQRYGGEIDAFYSQLKTEVEHGWILEPAPAEMREKQTDKMSA